MGSGAWTTSSYYTSLRSKGLSMDSLTSFAGSAQELYTSRNLDPALNPYGVIRECRDSAEHPHTFPVILALDVTGSMGSAAVEVAKTINKIMTELYAAIPDVQFMTMGIGDLAYDRAPIQASQFEADVRISEQLDKMYFEAGGGGNEYESYTAAWYFGLHHTDLDCWKRGEKGLIITMGDEPINPYLPHLQLSRATGDTMQGDVETDALYTAAADKFDIFHLTVDHFYASNNARIREYLDNCKNSFAKYLGERAKIVETKEVADAIINIVKDAAENRGGTTPVEFADLSRNENGYIRW